MGVDLVPHIQRILMGFIQSDFAFTMIDFLFVFAPHLRFRSVLGLFDFVPHILSHNLSNFRIRIALRSTKVIFRFSEELVFCTIHFC